MENKPNIILLTVDSLRADHLGFLGYQKAVSPNIDKLAQESAVFKEAYAVGPHSPYSFPAIFTSTYPLDYKGPMDVGSSRVFLSEVLKNNGYLTATFHATVRLSSFFGYDKGWDFFYDLEDPSEIGFKKKGASGKIKKKIKTVLRSYLYRFGLIWVNIFPSTFFLSRYLIYRLTKKIKNPNVDAFTLNKAAKEFISSHNKNKNQPIFLHIHYMDVHGPFFPLDYYLKKRILSRSEFIGKSIAAFSLNDSSFLLKRYIKDHLKKTLELYDDGIKYLDSQISDFFDFLKKENIWDNAIIIFTADHGEELWDHGEPAHGRNLYNELLHIPLIIKIPGKGAEIISHKVSLRGLAPTICDLVGVGGDPAFKGKNLSKVSRKIFFHQTAYNETKKVFKDIDIDNESQCFLACQTNKYKYIFRGDSGKEELYDLEIDPKEKNNIADREKAILLEMRKAIYRFKEKNPIIFHNN